MASIEELNLRRQAAQQAAPIITNDRVLNATMEAMPTMSELMAFSAFKGTNTILRGGFARRGIATAFREGGSKVAFSTKMNALNRRNVQRMNPRNLFRYPGLDRINPNIGNRMYGGKTLTSLEGGRARWRSSIVPRFENATVKSNGKFSFKTPASHVGTEAEARQSLSMFQLGRFVNYGLSKYHGTRFGSNTGLLAKRLPLMNEGARVPFATGGFTSTIFASRSLARTAGTMSQARAANVANYIRMSNVHMYNALGGEQAATRLASASNIEASQVLAMSGQGLYNQFLGGMFSAARAPITDMAAQAAIDASKQAGIRISGEGIAAGFINTMAGKGAIMQARNLAYGGFTMGERMGVRGFASGMTSILRGEVTANVERASAKYAAETALSTASKAVAEKGIAEAGAAVGTGMAAKFAARFGAAAAVNVIPGIGQAVSLGLTAWMIYDLAKLGGTLIGAGIKGAVNLGSEAVRSIEGSINKAPMSGFTGMGYRDTEAAATSRRRGVMAIQNSRLNARSVLGAEAPLMHSHFG